MPLAPPVTTATVPSIVHQSPSVEQPAERVGAVHRLGERRVVGAPAEVVAAVDADRLAGDPRRLGTGEEAHERGDVVGRADPCRAASGRGSRRARRRWRGCRRPSRSRRGRGAPSSPGCPTAPARRPPPAPACRCRPSRRSTRSGSGGSRSPRSTRCRRTSPAAVLRHDRCGVLQGEERAEHVDARRSPTTSRAPRSPAAPCAASHRRRRRRRRAGRWVGSPARSRRAPGPRR